MKPLDSQLKRLFKAAAAAPNPPPVAAAFALEARVLGGWRGLTTTTADSGEYLVAWFRRAALCGCVLALASVAWTYQGRADRPGGSELAIADSVMRLGVEP